MLLISSLFFELILLFFYSRITQYRQSLNFRQFRKCRTNRVRSHGLAHVVFAHMLRDYALKGFSYGYAV